VGFQLYYQPHAFPEQPIKQTKGYKKKQVKLNVKNSSEERTRFRERAKVKGEL